MADWRRGSRSTAPARTHNDVIAALTAQPDQPPVPTTIQQLQLTAIQNAMSPGDTAGGRGGHTLLRGQEGTPKGTPKGTPACKYCVYLISMRGTD